MNEMSKRTLKAIPEDFPVRPLTSQAERNAAHHPTQDGQCGLWWDDAIATASTPTPAGRCPFEAFHPDEEEQEEQGEAGPRETLAGIRKHAGNVTLVRMAVALEAVLDLADQLDFENQATHDYYGWPRGPKWETGAPGARIRETITTALEGKSDALA